MTRPILIILFLVSFAGSISGQRDRSPDYDLLAEEFLRENHNSLAENRFSRDDDHSGGHVEHRDHDIPSTVESLVDTDEDTPTTPTSVPYWVALFNTTFQYQRNHEAFDALTTEHTTTDGDDEVENINIEDNDDDVTITAVTNPIIGITEDVTIDTDGVTETVTHVTTDTDDEVDDTTTERTVSVEVPVNVAESDHAPLTVKVVLTIHNHSETATTTDSITDAGTTETDDLSDVTTTVEAETTTDDDDDDSTTTAESVLDDAVMINDTLFVNVTEAENVTEPGLESDNATDATVFYNATVVISANLTMNISLVNATDDILDDAVTVVPKGSETTETTTDEPETSTTEETAATEAPPTPEIVYSTIVLIPTTAQPEWITTSDDQEEEEPTEHPLLVFERVIHAYSLIIFALALIFIVILCCMYGACCSETGRVMESREVRINKNYPLDDQLKGRSLKGADEPLLTQI
ncbi:uncharacterized protein LOC129599454 [Paramacrobiotus metropolitanus]|uniref:uncharacterized protein LOC129599454 n=1 Tax=Paramacrobiotus metropolitanus TaxID=2943436 RepID=UPI002445CCA1|nr:uncharacterized protein LOC129599454 [Paramacrobiotus metropolitanus]